jgi:hypothetical protein
MLIYTTMHKKSTNNKHRQIHAKDRFKTLLASAYTTHIAGCSILLPIITYIICTNIYCIRFLLKLSSASIASKLSITIRVTTGLFDPIDIAIYIGIRLKTTKDCDTYTDITITTIASVEYIINGTPSMHFAYLSFAA